jgi:LmbE family N-acetylglucosaminyl deacetylase
MGKILVVAPHPDDETLGCGATLLRHKDDGDEIHWLIVTKRSEAFGYAKDKIERVVHQISEVKRLYDFDSVHQLDFDALSVDGSHMLQLVSKIGAVMKQIEPDTVFAPFPGDVHSDHRVIFDAVAGCGKWFRHPYVKRILAYEVISETDFDINPQNPTFRPNVFVDVSLYLEKKIQITTPPHNVLSRSSTQHDADRRLGGPSVIAEDGAISTELAQQRPDAGRRTHLNRQR